ncbi:MAG: (deoxy)nucleoside triphosphate pyrophosphohydrolase [Bacteroidales bacterium]|nr:(deoxy)nucleoside triphosphate pyrophosphohydrolase [Bacteroidales bacterium]
MKTVNVVAAIIVKDSKVFATQRGYGDWRGWWEFPGGKLEAGETPQSALIREIHEELSTEVSVGDLLHTIEYDYPTFHLSMQCFLCEVISGKLSLNEHEDAKWLTKEDLYSVKWLPADMDILPKIEAIL